ncbi:DUF3598 family protein [Chamaesiphon sp.]|uniref:DUF3598 family protein n=1 Tax=Chamaesiphon sp. TaxID=2814140 RepID=UPI003593AC62
MKSQWECVLENLGEWVGSFTTVTAEGEPVDDIPSVIKLAGVGDNQAVHLVLTRFYPLPNSTERYSKQVVWDFSTPPGIGAIYFETGAFSSGALTVTAGVKTIAEFSLIEIDSRFRMIQTFDPNQRLDRVTFIQEHRQETTTPERPHLNISDLLGTWKGTVTTLDANSESPIVTNTASTFVTHDLGYRLVRDDDSVLMLIGSANDLTVTNQLLRFSEADSQSYQMLLLPDGGYTTTPTQIRLGCPFYLELGWVYAPGKRQRLVRRYDSTGKWCSATFISEQIDRGKSAI